MSNVSKVKTFGVGYGLLFTFSIANLLLMHYYFYFNEYLEWTFLYSFAANFFSVFFDVSLLLAFSLLFCKFRLKAALAFTYAVTVLWALVNVFYVRFFSIYMPVTAISEVVSLTDSLVVSNIQKECSSIDLFVPFSLIFFVWLYKRTPRKQIVIRQYRYIILLAFSSLSLTLLSYSICHFVHPSSKHDQELLIRKIKELLIFVNDGGTPNLSRYQAGSIRTIAWDVYDALATRKLTDSEMKMVLEFIHDKQNKISENVTPHVQNVIFILLESFLSAPIDLVIGGNEITPFLNKLKQDSCVYYNGKMKSNVACGESGDGQFIYMTGMLPLRHKMVVSTLKEKEFPALPRLLTREFGIEHTEIIIPTQLNMWQQSDANKAYGIEHAYSVNDIVSYRRQCSHDQDKTDDVSDKDIFGFAASTLKTKKEPFFSMVLSVSTHSPYDKYCGEDVCKGGTNMPLGYRNYLNTCHFTDRWLHAFINMLKKSGLYERSLIVICSDHPAHLDRMNMIGRISTNTPLFIINGQISNAEAWNKEFHQVDVFTTLLDILNIRTEWKGLGHTLLNGCYKESVNDMSYSVSRLLNESDYFQK